MKFNIKKNKTINIFTGLLLLVFSGILSSGILGAQPFYPLCIENKTMRELVIQIDMDRARCIERTACGGVSWTYQVQEDDLLATEIRLYQRQGCGVVIYMGIYRAHACEVALLDERLYSLRQSPCRLPRSWDTERDFCPEVPNLYSRAYFEATSSQKENQDGSADGRDEEIALLQDGTSAALQVVVPMPVSSHSQLKRKLGAFHFVEQEVERHEQIMIANLISLRGFEEDGPGYEFSVGHKESTMCRKCCPSCCVFCEGVQVRHDTTYSEYVPGLCKCESTYGENMLSGKLSIKESPCCCSKCDSCCHSFCGFSFSSNNKHVIKCHWFRDFILAGLDYAGWTAIEYPVFMLIAIVFA